MACCAVPCCCCLQIIDAIFEQDPDGATLAFADMMKKQIVMPAHLMDDGKHEETNKGRNLFAVSVPPGVGDCVAEGCACPLCKHMCGRRLGGVDGTAAPVMLDIGQLIGLALWMVKMPVPG